MSGERETVTTEGGDLKTAIGLAAQQLGLHPGQVDYKLDLSHFRSAAGVSLARNTVRIVAWNSGRDAPAEGADSKPERRRERPERAPRADGPQRGEGPDTSERPQESQAVEAEDDEAGADEKRRRRRRKRGRDEGESESPARNTDRPGADRPGADRAEPREREEPRERSPGKPESLRGAEGGTTDASEFAQRWFQALLQRMGVDGTVTASGSAERVHLAIKAERAGRIVGKRGATLGSIRHLLGLAIEQRFGPLTIDVDVGDDRPREDRDSRGFDRDRDREPRGFDRERSFDRDRDRDRGPRGGAGGRREGPRGGRDRSGDRGRYPEEKLRALAQRAAEKAMETGQTITINLELNSFDRRIVHLEVANMGGGVESRSEERPGPDGRLVKYVQIMPAQG